MTVAHPLLRHERLDAIVGFHDEEPVTVETFLQDAMSLADLLPPRRCVINLCRNRYRFTVALAAALLREQLSLMPPSDAPGVLGDIATRFDGLYCLHDGTSLPAGLPAVRYPDRRRSARPSSSVPFFPDDQPAVVLFTSGSSGRPTPHQKSWGALVRSALAAGARLGVCDRPGATVIGTVPQQHSYGLESTVLLALQHGLALQGARPFYPADIVACLAVAARPRILVTTPIHLRAMLADTGELPELDLLISATAPLSVQLAAEAERRFGAPLLEIYGCSEAGQLAVRRTAESVAWQCLDSVVLHQDATGTRATGAAVEGNILLNDIIELSGPDRFFLHGRAADLINIAGKRTSLAYLNHQLGAIPGVTDGVFVMPEEEGEGVTRLAAFVVAPGLSAEIILDALRQRIDAAFLPRPLRLVDALPRNPLGKLPREAALRLMAGKRN